MYEQETSISAVFFVKFFRLPFVQILNSVLAFAAVVFLYKFLGYCDNGFYFLSLVPHIFLMNHGKPSGYCMYYMLEYNSTYCLYTIFSV